MPDFKVYSKFCNLPPLVVHKQNKTFKSTKWQNKSHSCCEWEKSMRHFSCERIVNFAAFIKCHDLLCVIYALCFLFSIFIWWRKRREKKMKLLSVGEESDCCEIPFFLHVWIYLHHLKKWRLQDGEISSHEKLSLCYFTGGTIFMLMCNIFPQSQSIVSISCSIYLMYYVHDKTTYRIINSQKFMHANLLECEFQMSSFLRIHLVNVWMCVSSHFVQHLILHRLFRMPSGKDIEMKTRKRQSFIKICLLFASHRISNFRWLPESYPKTYAQNDTPAN